MKFLCQRKGLADEINIQTKRKKKKKKPGYKDEDPFFAVTVDDDFLIELSGGNRGGLINVHIRLARRYTLGQSQPVAVPYNGGPGKIYGRHRRDPLPQLFDAPQPRGAACNNYYRISIRLSFAALHAGETAAPYLR